MLSVTDLGLTVKEQKYKMKAHVPHDLIFQQTTCCIVTDATDVKKLTAMTD